MGRYWTLGSDLKNTWKIEYGSTELLDRLEDEGEIRIPEEEAQRSMIDLFDGKFWTTFEDERWYLRVVHLGDWYYITMHKNRN